MEQGTHTDEECEALRALHPLLETLAASLRTHAEREEQLVAQLMARDPSSAAAAHRACHELRNEHRQQRAGVACLCALLNRDPSAHEPTVEAPTKASELPAQFLSLA